MNQMDGHTRFNNQHTLEVTIGDICDLDRRTIKAGDQRDLPYIGLEHVASQTGIIVSLPETESETVEGTCYLYDKRHVLYGKLRPYLNKVATPDSAGRCSMELVPLLPKPCIEREYLAYVLRDARVVQHVMATATGARMPRADIGLLMSFRFVLPSVEDRRRIVDILNHATSIKRLHDEANAKARELVPALFVDMFGNPATNPKGWDIRTVGEVLSAADYGTSVKATEEPRGVPVLRMGNVSTTGELLLDSLKYAEFSEDDLRKLRLRKGDILFNRTNSKDLVGKTGIWDGRFEAVAASYFIRLRVADDVVLPELFWAYFNTRFMKQRLFETARGAIGQSNINTKELRAFSIPIPPIALQRDFSEHISEIEGIRALNEKATTTADQMAQSLIAQVFGSAP